MKETRLWEKKKEISWCWGTYDTEIDCREHYEKQVKSCFRSHQETIQIEEKGKHLFDSSHILQPAFIVIAEVVENNNLKILQVVMQEKKKKSRILLNKLLS